MSEKYVIVVGDKTTHSGTVLIGDEDVEISGKAVACLGHKVHCPSHGETEIVEGFLTTLIEPNKIIAYEGCRTSCGAQLIAGGQDIVCVDADVSEHLVSTFVNTDIVKENEKPESKEVYEPEFALFVATVYGEAASQSEGAWKAVGSVIMNRLNNKRFAYGPRGSKQIPITVKEVVETGRFDAQWRRNEAFRQAEAYFKGEGKPLKIDELIISMKPIFYGNIVTTDAVMYYSPKTQQYEHKHDPVNYKELPDWDFNVIEEASVKDLRKKDDFKFYRYKK